MRTSGELAIACLGIGGLLLTLGCGVKSPDAARGEQIFNARCWNCHEKDSDLPSPVKGRGIGLKGYVGRSPHSQQDGSQHEHTDEFIGDFIRNGSMNMPPQKDFLSSQDLADLVIYLKTL